MVWACDAKRGALRMKEYDVNGSKGDGIDEGLTEVD